MRISTREYVEAMVDALRREGRIKVNDLDDRVKHLEQNVPTVYITERQYDRDHEDTEKRLGALENWQANVTGRAIGLAIVGGVFIAAIAAEITHLLGG